MREPRSPWAEIVGPCYMIDSFGQATGISVPEVQTAAADLRALALTTADGDVVLPSFQMRDGQLVPHLERILGVLRSGIDDPWTWAQWLSADLPDEGRHIDHLWAGEVASTRSEAEHDAWAWRS